MMEDELRQALSGSLEAERAGEIAREVAPILDRHPLLPVLGPSAVISAALPAITLLAESSPNASAEEIAREWQEAQEGSAGPPEGEPGKPSTNKGRRFWKRASA